MNFRDFTNFRRFGALSLLLLFALTGVQGCSGKKEPKRLESITFAVTPWPASTPFFVAREKGYFRDEGLDATFRSYPSGHLALAAMLSGATELAATGETPIVRAAMKGKPVAVIATVCEIDRAHLIIARKDKGIRAPGDLRGKKIGVVAGTTADFFLHIYLTTSYIDPGSVQIINLAPEEIVEALLSGEVDAVSTWPPHTIVLQEKLGPNALVLYDPSIYTMTWNLVATQDFAKDHPDRVKKFLRAIVRANRFIAVEPAESHAISSKHVSPDIVLLDRAWEDYRFTLLLDQSLVLNMEDQARWIIRSDTRNSRKPPNFLDFIYADGLKAVLPEGVRIAGK